MSQPVIIPRSLSSALAVAVVLGLAACGDNDSLTGTPCNWYVSAVTGSDSGMGSAGDPFKTITFALTGAGAGEAVCVSAGTYDAVSTGESFPITVPADVTLKATADPSLTLIEGSGDYQTGFANVTLIVTDGSAIEGFSIRVPATDPGTVHVGVIATSGKAAIRNNVFVDIAWGLNGGAGVASVGDAYPLIEGNTITGCHDGIATFDTSAPVIRRNALSDNEDQGVYAGGDSIPDLGTTADPGENDIQNNGSRGLYNFTAASVISAVGNTWNINCTTDANGRFASRLVNGPADNADDCTGEPSNYRIENIGAGIQF